MLKSLHVCGRGFPESSPQTLVLGYLLALVHIGVLLEVDGGPGRLGLEVEADARAHGVGGRAGAQAQRVGVGRGPGPLVHEAQARAHGVGGRARVLHGGAALRGVRPRPRRAQGGARREPRPERPRRRRHVAVPRHALDAVRGPRAQTLPHTELIA